MGGFLDDTAGGDAALIRFLQQWSGYCLTGDTSLEELLFVHGPAGSGKSTFVAALAGVMGDYALNTPSETLMQRKHAAHREELARLHGARLVWSSEIEDGQRWNEKRIAELTGDDTVTARFMHSNSFDFRPQFKLVIAGNSRPDLRDVGGAMRRRFNVMPFDRQPSVRDTSLKPYLLSGAEFPGILAWAIQGCLDWQQNGLIKPRKLLDATEDYLAAQDTFGQWIAERCETGPHLADTTEQPAGVLGGLCPVRHAAWQEPLHGPNARSRFRVHSEHLWDPGTRLSRHPGLHFHVGRRPAVV